MSLLQMGFWMKSADWTALLNSFWPLQPTLKPATWHPYWILCLTFALFANANIVAAMNVSPAPTVSTTVSGEYISLSYALLSTSIAAAPSSPQAQITTQL